MSWPCDTAIVIERLRAVEAELAETRADRDERASRHLDSEYDLVIRLSDAQAERDRWREDAERLAEALASLGIMLDRHWLILHPRGTGQPHDGMATTFSGQARATGDLERVRIALARVTAALAAHDAMKKE